MQARFGEETEKCEIDVTSRVKIVFLGQKNKLIANSLHRRD